MNKLEVIKVVGGCIGGLLVGSFTGHVVKIFTPSEVSKFGKICCVLGGSILTSMVADKAALYVSNEIENTAKLTKILISKN